MTTTTALDLADCQTLPLPDAGLSHGAIASVVGATTLVPLADGTTTTYANLDIAASAPALEAVAARIEQILPWYASVHRGAGYLSQVATSLYESARTIIAEFCGARSDDLTVIVRNTTDAVNLLATATPGDVLVLDVEHHANLLPWRTTEHQVTTVPAADTITETLSRLDEALQARSYALLAITGASNVTGEALPLSQVIDIAHRHGTRVLVDAAQLAPHRRFSIAELDIDYAVLSGHKLYAPYGAGVLVGRRDWLDQAPAYLAGGGAVSHVSNDDVSWQPGPARHEAGSPNVLGAVALATAAQVLTDIGDDRLQQHDQVLRTQLTDGLSKIDGVTIARIWQDSGEPVGVVTFEVADYEPGLVAMYLSAEHGIGVRDGKFCAHPLLRRIGLSDGAVRASIGLGTTSEHIDRLLVALQRLVTEGPREQYRVEGGAWVLANDRRPLPINLGLDELIATAAATCGQIRPPV